ncbi:hypothetical protein ACFQ5M_07365 [Agrilactobacillus yilanensis]|uniref:Uncharacterized protein n=1 Tax=Agrilactobacillus yilanensis TaxID=2485997 RepID=A0ABW4J6A5_9LACO|nr:hypothetical protein [Agrilactobacillus yilanensis]
MQLLANANLVTPLLTVSFILILSLAAILLQTLAHYYKSYDKKVEKALQIFSLLGFSLLAVNLIIVFLGFQASEDKTPFQANVWLILASFVSLLSIGYCLYARYNLFADFNSKSKHASKK